MSFDRKEYMRRWYEANREKERERQRKRYSANRETVLARTGAYQKAHPEKVREWARRYSASNREKCAAGTRRWRKENPEHKTLLVAARRALKKAAKCECCGPISFKFIYLQARSLKMEVDHVTPLAKGGKHCLRNMQLLEPVDNRRKGARLPEAA